MATIETLDKTKWIGYRWHQHGFAGDIDNDTLHALLFLGIQDSRQNGQVVSLSQRRVKTGGADPASAVTPTGPLVNIWSVRGAPHAHAVSQLDLIKQAHAPQASDEGGETFVEDVRIVAAAMSEVVTRKMTKGKVSAEVTQRVPGRLVVDCERCQARHLPDRMFRAAGLAAQVVLGPLDKRSTTLCPKPKHTQEPSADARHKLIETLFRINGPVSRRQVQDWLLASPDTLTSLLATIGDELVPVSIDGHKCVVPAILLERIKAAEPAKGTVFLPPHDPYLRQVDRTLLIADKSHRMELFKSLSGPGAVVVDGDVVGTWRFNQKAGITVSTFSPLSKAAKARAEEPAELLRTTLGGATVALAWND